MIAKVRAGIRSLLPKNTFARGVSVLVGGTAGAQLLTVLAAPILTRLYSPEDFGLLAVYASLLGLIGVVASLRYELAIPLPESDEEAAHVVVLSLLIVLGMTVLAAIVIMIFGSSIANALGVPALTDYLWLLPVGVLLGGVYNVFNYWAVRTKSFTTIAGTKIRQAVVSLVIQLTAFKLGGIALLFAQVAGQSMGAWILGKGVFERFSFQTLSFSNLKIAGKRYYRFPMFSSWEGLLNSISHQIAPLGFAALFSVTSVGFYALAHRILTVPLSLIGSAISNVFFSAAAEDKQNLSQSFETISKCLIQIALPPMVLLAMVAPALFEFLFGASWRTAGEFVRWMTPWLYLQFISSPLSIIFPVLEEQAQGMTWQILLVLLRIAALFLGSATGEILSAIIYFSIASSIAYLILFIWLARLVGSNIIESSKQFGTALLWSALICTPIALPVLMLPSVIGVYTTFICFFLSTIFLAFRYALLARGMYKQV
ncbi:oligosaccharide flippase family protein [Fluviibacter phosphoraccumulans]